MQVKAELSEQLGDKRHVQSSRTDQQWPAEATIVYPMSGDIKLTDQPDALAHVVREAMKEQTRHLLWINAFPSTESRVKLTRQWLLASAKGEDTKSIKRRVKKDNEFVQHLHILVVLIFPVLLHDNDASFITDFCPHGHTSFTT